MIVDLHTHSTCSDGSLTPTALVSRAAAAGITMLALTDHDTVAGVEDAQRCATALGIQLVPGVEISAAWRGQSVHVLGLWIDPASRALRDRLQAQAELRRARMRKMCERLNKLRLPGAQLLAAVEMHAGLPTRAHLAQALTAAGHVATPQAAFRQYLSQGKRAYVATAWPALDEVLDWILAAGGVASLAHPLRYPFSSGARRRLIKDFTAGGGTALEVLSGGNGAQLDTCAALAVNFGLTGSVGSDFHHPGAAWNPLGRSLKLPDCVTPVWRRFGLSA